MRSTQPLKTLTFILLASLVGSAVAQSAGGTLPTASSICAEAHANILRARLKHIQNPMQDTAVITRIFQAGGNDYAAELRPPTEVDRKYPNVWVETFYLINKGEQTLTEQRLAYSVGDALIVQGNVTGISLVERSDNENTRPACKISVAVDWDKAAAP